MQEIKCPNCGQVFKIDESNYDSIVRQIRNHEFDKEVKEKLDAAISLEKKNAELLLSDKMNEKDQIIASLRQEIEASKNNETQKIENAISKQKDIIAQKEIEITKLKGDLSLKENNLNKEKEQALADKDKEILQLNSKLEMKNQEFEIKENGIRTEYETLLKRKQEEVDFYKDFKAKQSTKAIGESLEVYCSNEFNKIRNLAFPLAYFEKDNTVSKESGSKGDFIFRDYDTEGTEYVSIMFEMKNEADLTSTKHKNEDFLKELDKDRNEKKCEYAVLVSMLEADNELYNSGIVNVSHKYPKMYIVRPQFFLPIISLIRDGAYSSLNYKKELALVKSQDLDLEHFEDNLETFKSGFSANYERAKVKFTTAIDEIDKSIQHLQKIKDALQSSDNQLRLANNKVQDLTIKKITKNAPSIKEKLEEIRESKE